MAPKLVTPYRISGNRGKSDAADAEPGHRLSRGQPVPGEEPGVPARRALQGAAICKAMQRPNMRFVPVKTEDQQARLIVHRARQGFVTARTACINRIRGLLSEFGIVLPLKAEVVRRGARNHLEDLPGFANLVIGDLLSEVAHLDERIKQYDAHIRTMARDCKAAQQLMQLMGIGEVTATAIIAIVSNAAEFSCGRQFSAWLGQVPGQYSSGGKARLGRITKAGDAYLRSLLVMGARAVRIGGAYRGQDQERQPVPLGGGPRAAARLLEGGGGDCRQERPHGLGGAYQG